MSEQQQPGAVMPHSKEPWRDGRTSDSILSSEESPRQLDPTTEAYYGGQLVAESMTCQDRRRIIACVNACAGIPTEMLERVLEADARLSVFDDPSGGLNCDLVEASNGR